MRCGGRIRRTLAELYADGWAHSVEVWLDGTLIGGEPFDLGRRGAGAEGRSAGAAAPFRPGHAVWLCPTPGFRRAAFGHRGSLLKIAGKTSDPDKALHNLLERDRMFTDRLRQEAAGLGLPVIDVDTTVTEDDLAGRVARAFGL